MPIEWKTEYAVGDAEIDAEHQELFRLASRLITASGRVEQANCASGFYAYTRKHFKHEEDLMRRLDYPEMEQHLEQHADLLERLDGVTACIASGKLQTEEVIAFTNNWLLTHIRLCDTRLAAVIKA